MILLSDPTDFDDILDNCKSRLGYNYRYFDFREEIEDAERTASNIIKTIKDEILWKVDEHTSYEIKFNATAMLASLMTASLEIKQDGEWGSMLKERTLPEAVSLALVRIGKLMSKSEKI